MMFVVLMWNEQLCYSKAVVALYRRLPFFSIADDHAGRDREGLLYRNEGCQIG